MPTKTHEGPLAQLESLRVAWVTKIGLPSLHKSWASQISILQSFFATFQWLCPRGALCSQPKKKSIT